jgi:hypothetical protein
VVVGAQSVLPIVGFLSPGNDYGMATILTAEQRQALELIASLPRGCTKGLLLADGFAADMLADLIREGLATAHRGAVRAGGRQIRVERYRITDAGRKAIEG